LGPAFDLSATTLSAIIYHSTHAIPAEESMTERTRYQEGIIRRFYQNRDQIAEQRLGELVAEIYLAEGKKRDRLWKNAATALEQIGIPKTRIDHIIEKKDPALLAGLMKELQAKK
jgi:hypothetical protein